MSSPDQQPLHKGEQPNYVPGTDLPRAKPNRLTGYTIMKILVVLYSFLFLLIGLIILAVAIWVGGVKKDYESINDLVTSPTILAIVVGIFMIIFAFCGIIGALRESLILLKIFLAVIIIVFIFQVIVGILAFVYRERTAKKVGEQMEFALKSYHTNEEVKTAFDYLQRKFECCGLGSPNDWEKNENFSCSAFGQNACSVPRSCCIREAEGCGIGVRLNSTSKQEFRRKNVNGRGCTWDFLIWVEDHLDAVGATTLGLAIPQILGIFLVFVFIQKVEDRIFLFKYRKRIYEN